MNIAIEIFGILGALATIGLGIPQLIQQLKSKKTGKVNFASFWIFYVGILLWVAYGVFAGPRYWQVFIANFVCIAIYSATMFYLYYYREDKNKKLMLQVILGIVFVLLLTLLLAIIFTINIVDWFKSGRPEKGHNYPIPILSESYRSVIAAIAPSLTTLAFLPQLIISLKKKDFKGLTPWMPFLFMINNGLWIIYFILIPVHKTALIGAQQAWLEVMPALIWQIVSLTIYAIQFGMIYSYYKRMGKHVEKNKSESLEIDSTILEK